MTEVKGELEVSPQPSGGLVVREFVLVGQHGHQSLEEYCWAAPALPLHENTGYVKFPYLARVTLSL